MQRSTLVGIKVGLLAVLIIVGLLGMTTNAPVTEWLQEAFLGIAFTFAFGLGAPTALAYFFPHWCLCSSLGRVTTSEKKLHQGWTASRISPLKTKTTMEGLLG